MLLTATAIVYMKHNASFKAVCPKDFEYYNSVDSHEGRKSAKYLNKHKCKSDRIRSDFLGTSRFSSL